MHNLSSTSDEETARTHPACAEQRAFNTASFLDPGDTVLELCAGPSLKTLTDAYTKVGLACIGNDIDPRWVDYYPEGHWRFGDAFGISYEGVSGIVFAPPLSSGCTGKREDSLSIDDVRPGYLDFLWKTVGKEHLKLACLVLPARSLSTRTDRTQLHRLISFSEGFGRVHQVELVCGTRSIRKYIDLYIELRN